MHDNSARQDDVYALEVYEELPESRASGVDSYASTSLQLMHGNLAMLETFVASTERLAEIVRRPGHKQEAEVFRSRAALARRRVAALRVLAANMARRGSETHLRDGLTASLTRQVSTPETWMARLPALTSQLPGYAQLTRREREVLLLLIKGCSNREIAERLVISAGTAANHVSRVLDKVGCRSRVQLLGALFGLLETQQAALS